MKMKIQTILIILVSFLGYSECNIIFSKDSGFYPEEFLLSLSSLQENSKIFYTLDGSSPISSPSSKEYTEPILIKDRTEEPNNLSNYEEVLNSQLSICLNMNYSKPNFLVDKAMIVRAVLKTETGFDKIYDKTYFITTGDLVQYQSFNVISIVTDPENLFDPKIGIYVTGSEFIPTKDNLCINGCNFLKKGKEWERESHISIFEKGKILIDENVGIRIKGASTRNYPQKSFNIYFPKKYEKNKIKSDFLFPEK